MKEAKEKWLKAIKENKGEITPFTEYKFGGIYMLYIDNFEDKHIIPIYIGKTNHFQKRHKEHFRKLLELNKKNYNGYCNYIRSFEIEKRNKSNDNGNYRYCKIFKYLIDHNLTLDNLHMIILKNEDNSQELERLESKYINYFQSDIYGFNTLNSLSNQFKYKNDEENPDFLDLINQDIDKCLKYQNCGYTTFNTWNFYRRFVAQNVEVKEKITPLIMETLNYYDDNGVRMFDEKGSFEEYFKNLVLKSNQLNFELLQIKEKLKLKIAELIKGKYVERNTEKCINFIIVKIFYKIITSLGYKHKFTLDFISYNMDLHVVEYNYNSDETDDKVHQGALKIMREIDFIKIFKDDLVKWKKDFEEFVENDRKIKCFPYKYFDLITNESLDEEVREFYKKELYYGNFIDLINRSSRIPHPSKTIFRYILPSKEFKENIISKKYISPLNYINTYKNDNDVSMICIFNDETKMDEYYGGINFIYIGICYKDIQSEIMFRPDFDINTDVEYYTTISSSNIIPEEDSAKFYEKLEQILEMVRNNIKIFIDVYYISSNLKTATEIITNTFKEYGFINFERVRIKKIIK